MGDKRRLLVGDPRNLARSSSTVAASASRRESLSCTCVKRGRASPRHTCSPLGIARAAISILYFYTQNHARRVQHRTAKLFDDVARAAHGGTLIARMCTANQCARRNDGQEISASQHYGKRLASCLNSSGTATTAKTNTRVNFIDQEIMMKKLRIATRDQSARDANGEEIRRKATRSFRRLGAQRYPYRPPRFTCARTRRRCDPSKRREREREKRGRTDNLILFWPNMREPRAGTMAAI
ncbi:unnamed protein product [Trichogramma brassicae]|uniref:Uncharacterized protein n=1 Tax=Trichogramma brassicae TaxID=86971 RepID=A0A6H5IF02_9HYME|nr:unnamed protein product [Trichogramma brassicae]